MKKLLFIISFWVYVMSVSAQQDTITTETGLQYYMIEEGEGEKVQEGKEVALHGIGTFENGEVFWETRESNSPFYFVSGTNSVIKGVEEGVSKMRVGDRWIFILPPELAYGNKQRGPIPPNSVLIFDYEILNVSDPKKPIVDTLYKTIHSDGIDKALDLYVQLKDQRDVFNFRADQLNVLGYKLLNENKLAASRAVLELNTREHPDNFNTWDSLGEIYMVLGQNDLAIESYKKSLQLYPKNTNAIERIKKIEAKK